VAFELRIAQATMVRSFSYAADTKLNCALFLLGAFLFAIKIVSAFGKKDS